MVAGFKSVSPAGLRRNSHQDKLKISGDAENPLQLLIQRIQGSAIKPVHESVVEECERAA